MAYDGSIRINTKIDGKGFDTGVKRMMSSLGSLAASLGVVFGVAGLVNFGKKSVETAMQMEAGWQGLRYMANAYGKDLNQISKFLQDFTADGLVPMMNAQQAYKNMIARGYNTDQLEDMLLIMKDSSVYLRKGQLDIGEAIEKTTMGLRTERSILTDSSGIEKNMYKMWQAYAKEIGTTISALTHEQKLLAEYQGFMKEGAVYAGAASEYTKTYAGRVAQLTAAMIDLKVAVGNMVIPLLNAMLPKIILLVKWFTYWFNIIGRVMNLLFGTNVGASSLDGVANSTYEAADAQDELANATDRAGKAAKGALASFDKLNVLQQPASGSGGGAGDISLPVEDQTVFDDVSEAIDELEQKLIAFKEKLLAFFAPLKEPFERLKEAFLTLGATIGAGLGWAWTNILLPFLTWIVQSVAPVALDIISGALRVLNEILIAVSPLFLALWENILLPLGQWAGEIFIQALTWIVEKLTQLSNWISTHQETVQTIATILGSFAAAWILVNGAVSIWNGVVATAIGVIKALITAIAFLTSTTGLVVLAIGLLIIAIVFLKDHWGEIKEVAANVWEKIVEIWGVVAGWFSEHVVEPLKKTWGEIEKRLEEFKVFFTEKVVEPLKEKFGNLVEKWQEFARVIKEKVIDPLVSWFQDWLWPKIQTVLSWIGTAFDVAFGWWLGLFTGVFSAITGVIQGALEIIGAIIGMIIDVIAGIITFLTGVFTGDWKTAWQGIKDIFGGIWDGIVGVLKGVINSIIGMVNGLISGVVRGMNSVANVLNGLRISIPDWVPVFGGNTFSLNIPTFTAPQIPYLATGAVIPANAPFAAILGDQRSGRNIEAPENLIRQIMREEMRGMSASEPTTIHNILKLDGKVVFESMNRESVRRGNSLLSRGAA